MAQAEHLDGNSAEARSALDQAKRLAATHNLWAGGENDIANCEALLKTKPISSVTQASLMHVLVTAPIEIRLKRVQEDLRIDPENARREVSRFDSGGREFIKRYFKAKVWDPVNYDLEVNTEHLSYQAAAQIIINALSYKNETVSRSLGNHL